VDGHDLGALARAMDDSAHTAPHVILAQTTFGKGVSFMERGTSVSRPDLAVHAINWHYLPMSADEYAMAMAEVNAN
jgi:transketolase